jgi:hypothetical protein
MLEHPEIGWIERTGYPSWMQEDCFEDGDEDDDSDRLYEEIRNQRRSGD